MNLVIIGFGVSAYWAIKTLLAEGNGFFSVTVITPECEHFCYKSFFGNYLIGSVSGETPCPYESIKASENIKFLFGKYVVSLNSDSQFLKLNTGETIFYDALLIASGAGCTLNDFEDTSIKGVFRFDSIEDVLDLRPYLNLKKKNAVVFGENYYAFELARTLLKFGLRVSIVCEGDYPCQRFLTKEAAGFALRSLLFEISVITNNSIKKVIADNNHVKAVELVDGKLVDADLIGLCNNIYPKSDFLAEYKDSQGKILVDKYMCTQMPGVFAAGDVAFVKGEPYELSYGWLRAHDQGKIVAHNLLGKNKECSIIPSLRMQVLGNPLVIFGEPVNADDELSVKHYSYKDDELGIYRSVVLKDKKIVHAVFCGDLSNVAVVEELILSNQEINDISEIEFYLKFEGQNENLFATKFCPFCKTTLDFLSEIDNGTVFTCPVCYVDLKILKNKSGCDLLPQLL